MDKNSHAQDQADQKSIEILAQAVTKAINDSKGDSRFIDLSRIPLICLSITNIERNISEIKEMIVSNRKEADEQHKEFVTKNDFAPYKTALNTVAGLILVGVVGALLSLVFIK